MSKKDVVQEIIGFIERMEGNTYLLPDSWSPEVQMATRDFAYKTYVGTRGSYGRYINIDIADGIKIDIRKNTVSISNLDISQPYPKLEYIRDIVKAIYEEKHSFADTAEGLAQIRTEITAKKKDIKQAKEELTKLDKQLADYLALAATRSDTPEKEVEV